MRPLSLNRRFPLEAESRLPDGAGGFVRQWQALGMVWGRIEAGAGRETSALERREPRVPLRIILRAAPVGAEGRPEAGQRLREGPRVFRILAVAEHDQRGLYLACHAEEEAGP